MFGRRERLAASPLILAALAGLGCGGQQTSGAASMAAPAAPKAFEYAPFAGQYRVTAASKTTQEMMGQRQEADQSSRQVITMTVTRPSKDTVALAVVIDSFNMVGPMGMTPPDLGKLIGVKVTAKLSSTGRLYSAEGPKEGEVPNASQVVDGLSHALLHVKATTLAKGATWSDTTTSPVRQNTIDLTRVVASTYTVESDTVLNGEKAWKISHNATTKLTGTGTMQGQTLTLDRTGTMKGVIFVSPAGVPLGGSTEELSGGKVVIGNGMEVGLTTTGTTKIERIR